MRSDSGPEKTVYILGAGFSAPAGGPNQADILKEILALEAHDSGTRGCLDALRGFLVGTLNVDPKAIAGTALEDIYTPIDRCINDGLSLRGKTREDLLKLRGQMEYLVSIAIRKRFESARAGSRNYVKTFAAHLVGKAVERSRRAIKARDAAKAEKYDPLSVISLNWDILLDVELHNALRARDSFRAGDYDPIGVVDYCCYISPIHEEDRRIRPGLWALGAKGYNVKLLKIHGSMNWLQCPNCQRMFVGFDEKLILPNYINPALCRHCDQHGHESHLRGTMVMPTFLKDLSNFQLKLVWQNAGVELMEARNLVFIGYSLPHADFEFRQLLSRMVHKEATIHVVLFEGRKRTANARAFKEECGRDRQFFSGHRRLTFESGGVIEYVRKLVT